MDDKEKRDKLLERLGHRIAKLFPGMFGSVRYNIKDGRLMNWNIEESRKPKGKK